MEQKPPVSQGADAPGGGSDARAAVDVPTQTPEAGASQMLPDPGVLDL